MAYDAARQRVVLSGGQSQAAGYLTDTWEWDGTTWTQRTPPASPPAAPMVAMAYDASRQRVVLFALTATWEWDGTTWTQRTPSTGPSTWGGAGLAMTYDSARARLVTFGAGPAQPMVFMYFEGNTWLLGGGARASAAVLGSGCSGSNGVPVLTSNEPFLGNPALLLDLLGARATAACAFALSAQSTSQSIGACTLYLQSPIVPVMASTNAFGFASIQVRVPNLVALRGQSLYAQAFVVDAQSPVVGVAFTAARRLVAGD